MRCLVITWIVLGACSSAGPQRIGAQPSWRDGGSRREPLAPLRTSFTFAPAGEPTTHYNDAPAEAPSTPLNDAVTAVVREAATTAGVHIPVPDARLFRACADLASLVPENAVLDYKFVEFALQRHGIIEPSPRLLVVWGAIDSPQVVAEQLKPLLADLLADHATARLGIGAARRKPDGTGAVVFALQGSDVSTLPIPRAVAADATITIDAVIDPRFRDPEVFITREDGTTQRLDARPGRPGGVIARFACAGHRGRQQIEIAASDAAGATVLANFPVWCGVAPPRAIVVEPDRDERALATTGDAERRLLASVNRDRIAARLAPLVWDERLADVARRHSDEMQRTHVVAHVSTTTGSVADRIAAAHISAAMVLENLARAYGVDEVHDGLMNSPGHRMNLMSKLATNIGIGVTFGDEIAGRRELFVTQVFTRVRPNLDRAQALLALRQRIATTRQHVVHQPQLDGLAQQLADAFAAGKTRQVASAGIQSQLNSLRNYKQFESTLDVVADLDILDGEALIRARSNADVGVGVAQGAHAEIGDNAIWVVLLFGTRRAP